MIFNKAKKAQRLPTLIEIEHAVKRNFGGLEDFDTWEYFRQELKGYRLPLRVRYRKNLSLEDYF